MILTWLLNVCPSNNKAVRILPNSLYLVDLVCSGFLTRLSGYHICTSYMVLTKFHSTDSGVARGGARGAIAPPFLTELHYFNDFLLF